MKPKPFNFSILRLAAVLGAAAAIQPAQADVFIPFSRDLGKAEAQCRAGEQGPAVLVDVAGMKDRKGLLKLEVYPSNDEDFLKDDTLLLGAGKVFRRVEQAVPASGPVTLCIRVPAPGAYSLSLLHDRDANHKFSLWTDGIGFAGNPKLHWSKPKAAATMLIAGAGITRTTIVMNYRRGLGMGPLKDRE